MFPVLRYFCLLIPWSFTESEKTSIIPFSVKNAKEEKQLYGYQKTVYPLCIPECWVCPCIFLQILILYQKQ